MAGALQQRRSLCRVRYMERQLYPARPSLVVVRVDTWCQPVRQRRLVSIVAHCH